MPRGNLNGLKIRTMRLDRKLADCPICKSPSKRSGLAHRWLRELGLSQPVMLEVTYSKHLCPNCGMKFNLPMDHLASPDCGFTNRVRNTALDLIDSGKTVEEAAEIMKTRFHVHVTKTTISDWIAVYR